ncbi:hypothetical protein [Paenarthrobacter sp. 22069]|uniref:hypothetical protein n=1 Tax=Paenarthrobacter sp. 22069 TaxID=3453864 RepID=UPI003F874E8B
MSSKFTIYTVLLVGSLALSGCSSSKPAVTAESTTTATPTVTAPPANGGSYSTVSALKAAYVKAGGACPDFIQTNKITLAAESAECSSNTVISTYLSSSDISQLIQNVKKLNADLKSSGGNSWLVGENWVINSPTTAEVQGKLGGKLVSF